MSIRKGILSKYRKVDAKGRVTLPMEYADRMMLIEITDGGVTVILRRLKIKEEKSKKA